MKNIVLSFATVALQSRSLAQTTFPTCGSCWCVPDDGGLDPCPSNEPQSTFDNATIDGFSAKQPQSIYALDCNPYENSTCETTPPQEYLDLGDTAVCAFVYEPGNNCSEYSMRSFPSEEAFKADPTSSSGVITHVGSCGLCSTAQDLSVYLREDFTTAGKYCATVGLHNSTAGQLCYEALGLTPNCAKIWNFDGIYDGQQCLEVCLSNLVASNNGPPPACALNPCLECDEVEAGPNFSAIGGRTRRRSGLLSEIIRNCSSIATGIVHDPSLNCPEALSSM
jgi:hypothetical protein